MSAAIGNPLPRSYTWFHVASLAEKNVDLALEKDRYSMRSCKTALGAAINLGRV